MPNVVLNDNEINQAIEESRVLIDTEIYECKKCKKVQPYDFKEKDMSKQNVYFKGVSQVYYECKKCKEYYPVLRTSKEIKEAQWSTHSLIVSLLVGLNFRPASLNKKIITKYHQERHNIKNMIKNLNNF